MKQHTVGDGECLSSIAAKYGLSWDAIWNDSANSALKEKRKDPNTLVPGDVLSLPDRVEKVVSCETAKVHRFKLSAEEVLLRLQLFEDEKPLADMDFELKVKGIVLTGKTDADGVLEASIDPQAREGLLTVGPEKKPFDLRFGRLQPITEIKGIQARLNNLGFDSGNEEDRLNPNTKEALRAFQKRFGLEVTGEPDQATVDKLAEIHDAVGAFPEPASSTAKSSTNAQSSQ